MKVWLPLIGQRYLLLSVALTLFFHNAWCISAQGVSVVGTAEQTNDRIQSLSTDARSASHEYTIGMGDLLDISVFDVPELSRELRVSQAGTINMPLVPAPLHVAGLSATQAEQVIADVLKESGLVSHPEVEVLVKEHRSRPITIVGAVQHPMVYEADHNVTLLEALAAAGGIANDAGDTIIVTRGRSANFVMIPNPEPVPLPPGVAVSAETSPVASTPDEKDTTTNTKPSAFPSATETTQSAVRPPASSYPSQTTAAPGNIITINLNELLEKGDTRNNITLQAGDVVTVPHAGIVYVLGAVTRPGGFVLSNDRTQLTTLKVLALAGGLTNIAKLDHAVIIRKDDQGKQTETEVDLKKIIHQQTEDLPMRASDILYIPDNRVKQALLQTLQLGLAIGTAVAIYRVAYQ